ncbi:MAG TPA: hypothetical protein VKE41_16035 [Roseiflexaceae bacterium]|nr:hypothetical protein [Roseiflexaceae bacterium]
MIVIRGNKIAAALAQAGSFATTWLFVRALGYTDVDGFLIAAVVEFILTAGKFPLLHSRGDLLGLIALILDTGLNAGGLWPSVQKFDQTPTAQMLSQALHLSPQMHSVPALFFALLFGFLLSALPHWLWARK